MVCGPKLSAVLNTELSSKNCTVVELMTIGGCGLVMVNSYFKYCEDVDTHLMYLEKILLATLMNNILISADANTRSTLWYNDSTDNRGAKIGSFILACDLEIANQQSVLTTFENTRGDKSNIDVTMRTSSRDMIIRDWEIHEESFLTDDRLITLLIECIGASGRHPQRQPLSGETPNRSTRNINWKYFDAILLTHLGEIQDF